MELVDECKDVAMISAQVLAAQGVFITFAFTDRSGGLKGLRDLVIQLRAVITTKVQLPGTRRRIFWA
ncbi:MAG: hypothetical protein QOD99_530 [Chthoniobacter sp.]|nr:hypothetical protein [Chthoniobacter sp.]